MTKSKQYSLDLDPRSLACITYCTEALKRFTGRTDISEALVIRRALLALAAKYSDAMQMKPGDMEWIKKGEIVNLQLMDATKDEVLSLDLSKVKGNLPPLLDCIKCPSGEAK